MAKPCTLHLITRKGYATSVRQQSCQRLCNAQRVQFFKPKTANVRGRGGRPLVLSLGGCKGGYSLSRKRVSPLNPREKGRGVLPLDPAYIDSLLLEELQCLPNQVRCTWLRHESSAICCRYQPRPTPWGASDGSTAADCLRGRHCCARRRWDCCFPISTVFFSVNGPQLMEIRAGQLRDLA